MCVQCNEATWTLAVWWQNINLSNGVLLFTGVRMASHLCIYPAKLTIKLPHVHRLCSRSWSAVHATSMITCCSIVDYHGKISNEKIGKFWRMLSLLGMFSFKIEQSYAKNLHTLKVLTKFFWCNLYKIYSRPSIWLTSSFTFWTMVTRSSPIF